MDITIICLLLAFSIAAPTYSYWRRDLKTNQRRQDLDRDVFEIIYPANLTEDRTRAFLNSIGASLRDIRRGGGIPTVVFETLSSDGTLSHRLRVPAQDADYLMGQLDTHLRGIDVAPAEHRLTDGLSPDGDVGSVAERPFTFGVRIKMTNPEELLRISNTPDHSAKVLKSLQNDDPRERVVLQWSLATSDTPKILEGSTPRPSIFQALLYGAQAQQSQVTTSKDQTFVVAGYIAARSENPLRAEKLVYKVVRALQSENKSNKFITHEIPAHLLNSVLNDALVPPKRWGNLLSVAEANALLGFPIGDPQIPGLTQGAARRIPPPATVATEGRKLGWSNVSSMRNRVIALSYKFAAFNSIYCGMIGSGKSVGMANSFFDDVNHPDKHGATIVDASGSRSPQSLAGRGLDYIPDDRIEDVIYVDVVGDPDNPVGFNPLDQGVGDNEARISAIFTEIYPDLDRSVAVRDLLYNGVKSIVEANRGLTLVDLGPLIAPSNQVEAEWADEIIDSFDEPTLVEFWDRMKKEGRGDPKKTKEWARYTDPLFRRLWQLVGRPEIRNMLGQNNNALRWIDVLQQNKIVIINLGGLPKDSAEILGSLMLDSYWSVAQTLTPESPDKGNALLLDEFQVTTHIKDGLADMLSRGRKHGVWVTLGTQFVSGLPQKTRDAITNNVGSRIVYRTSFDEAALWKRQFASNMLDESDFQHPRPFEAVAQILDEGGRSVVTYKARPEAPKNRNAQRVIDTSRRQNGRPVKQVQREMVERRRPTRKPHNEAPNIPKSFGRTQWNPDDESEGNNNG